MKCKFGFQPPETASVSVSIDFPLESWIDLSALRPLVSTTSVPIQISAPGTRMTGLIERESITAATLNPLAFKSLAVFQPSSLFV